MKNKQEKYCGFVINKTIYKDFDQIITILTSENQKISFKARSILKPNNKNAMQISSLWKNLNKSVFFNAEPTLWFLHSLEVTSEVLGAFIFLFSLYITPKHSFLPLFMLKK